jgi:hypothetical protein
MMQCALGYGDGCRGFLSQRRPVAPLPHHEHRRLVTQQRRYHSSWTEEDDNGHCKLYILMELCKCVP